MYFFPTPRAKITFYDFSGVDCGMRYFLTIIIIAIALCSYCQDAEIPSDSLAKYSYTLLCFKNKNPQAVLGTCFFINFKGNLFLITANHVLYECDSTTNKQKRACDFVLIQMPGSDAGMADFKISDTNDTCIVDYKDKDFVILRMDNKWLSHVNTVEKFILPPFKNYAELEIFGQGLQSNDSFMRMESPHHIHLSKNKFTIYLNTPTPDSSYIDSVHYFVEAKEIKVGSWLKGFSGSPVFLKDADSKRWTLCGIFIGGLYTVSEKLPGGLIFVKPEYFTRGINNR